MAGLRVDVHFTGEVEATATTGATGLWDEGRSCGLCCNVGRLSGGERGADNLQCCFSFLCQIIKLISGSVNGTGDTTLTALS